MVRLDGVGLRYGNGPEVPQDLSFNLPKGDFRWRLGASVAGKTSLFRRLKLAVRPRSGRLNVLGTQVETARRRNLPKLRRQAGTIYQDVLLLSHLLAFANVVLALRLAGLP